MEGVEFSNFREVIDQDIEKRIQIGERRLNFGIDFLDDFLMGIWKEDLVLVGAYSGAGKTQLVTNIALHNVEKGRNVHFFALEADEYEIERRILFNLVARLYFKGHSEKQVQITPGDFMVGNIAKELIHLELKAVEEFKKRFKTLNVAYKTGNFGIKEFKEKFIEVAAQGSDLIIIDHAHFFDWGDKQEYLALKEIVGTARQLNIENKVPVVLVSHLRKRDFKNDWYAPPMEEFHGSSELYKNATKVITLGGGQSEGMGQTSTFINAAKFRADGSRAKYLAKAIFNYRTLAYERGYLLGKPYQKRDREFEELAFSDYPTWSLRANRSGNTYQDVKTKPTNDGAKGGKRDLQKLPYKD